MTTIGIDPGTNGGIALIDERGNAHAHKMVDGVFVKDKK